MNSLRFVLDKLVADKTAGAQIYLRGQIQPIGPGTIERACFAHEQPDHLYRLVAEAHIGKPSSIPNMPPTMKACRIGIVFAADDVVAIMEPPVDADGNVIDLRDSAPQRPGNGRGGLVIGG